MTMKRHPAYCTLFPRVSCCDCGGEWKRVINDRYPFLIPLCEECGALPNHFRLRKVTQYSHFQDFCFDKKGKRIKTLDDALRVSLEIQADLDAGTYDKYQYRRKRNLISIQDTVSDFLRDHIIPNYKKLHMTLEDKIWLEDWMEPFLGDVGIFGITGETGLIYLNKFIKTFRFKDYEKERAERLFHLVREQIKL